MMYKIMITGKKKYLKLISVSYKDSWNSLSFILYSKHTVMHQHSGAFRLDGYELRP